MQTRVEKQKLNSEEKKTFSCKWSLFMKVENVWYYNRPNIVSVSVFYPIWYMQFIFSWFNLCTESNWMLARKLALTKNFYQQFPPLCIIIIITIKEIKRKYYCYCYLLRYTVWWSFFVAIKFEWLILWFYFEWTILLIPFLVNFPKSSLLQS